MVICDNSSYPSYDPKRGSEITLTRLSNYIPFLSDKNVAFIKIDVEGSEGKALEGGIELITKYHVPLIFLEFSPDFLKLHGTNPLQFLQLFIDNGYKIHLMNFFKDKDYTAKEILKKSGNQINLYIVHLNLLEKYFNSIN